MIIIPRAISGAGKTTLTKFLIDHDSDLRIEAPGKDLYSPTGLGTHLTNLRTKIATAHRATASDKAPMFRFSICSSDLYFERPDGSYDFDPAYLSAAHAMSLRNAVAALRDYDNSHVVIVDNTNCSIAEVAPYLALGAAYDHDIHVITLLVDPYLAWARAKHGTPTTNVVKQHIALVKSIEDWPPWWPQHIFPIASSPYTVGLERHGG